MAVATAVAGGSIDVGLVYLRCKALDLNFIPISSERYDLVIPEEYYI